VRPTSFIPFFMNYRQMNRCNLLVRASESALIVAFPRSIYGIIRNYKLSKSTCGPLKNANMVASDQEHKNIARPACEGYRRNGRIEAVNLSGHPRFPQ